MRPQTNTEILDRQPPCNIEAELGVLGSILLLPEVCDDVAMILHADDFYDDANRRLFGAIVAMHDMAEPTDVTTLAAHLKRAGDFESIGGAAYLAKVSQSIPNATNAEFYAKVVADLARKRRTIQAALNTLQSAYCDDIDSGELICQATAALEAIDTINSMAAVTAKVAVVDAIDHVHAVHREGKRLGLEIGLFDFDRRIGGLFGGELIVLAARPGMGKTSLALQILDHVAMGGHGVLFCTVEMSTRELMIRAICGKSGVNSRLVRTAELTEGDVIDFEHAAETLFDAPFVLLDKPELTVADIRREARRLHRADGLELLIVDYLGRLQTDDPRLPRYQQIGRMTGALKSLARELNIPVLVLSQLNREIEGRGGGRPKLSYLRESGSIEQDADVVLFIDRPEVSDPTNLDLRGKATLTVAKNRNGDVGVFDLVWDAARTTFKTAAPERYSCLDPFSDGSDMESFEWNPNGNQPRGVA